MAGGLIDLVHAASEEAWRSGAPVIGTEHLLLGAMRQFDDEAVRYLNALGFTHAAVSEVYSESMASGLQPRLESMPTTPALQYSQRAAAVLDVAHDMTDRGSTRVAHVLVALLLNRAAMSAGLLSETARRSGLTTFDPIECVQALLGYVKEEQTPARRIETVGGGLTVWPRARGTTSVPEQ